MRLLNCRTLQFEVFVGKDIPEYAILSHTWGQGEVSYQDFIAVIPTEQRKVDLLMEDVATLHSDEERIHLGEEYAHALVTLLAKKPHGFTTDGLLKVLEFCRRIRQTTIEWVWVDTCCINKESSTELSEAINSMYTWYKHSAVCWVFLADFFPDASIGFAGFSKCRWFSRSWTLQELVAPETVVFYTGDWIYLGDRRDLSLQISSATGIDPSILASSDSSHEAMECSAAKKMSWASFREATREEDIAYSLLGLFGVHMSLLYGEGSNAFLRLQKKIIKSSRDESIFAWDCQDSSSGKGLYGILATHPRAFAKRGRIEPLATEDRDGVDYDAADISSKGLSFSVYNADFIRLTMDILWLPLQCSHNGNSIVCIAVAVHKGIWYRVSDRLLGQTSSQAMGFKYCRDIPLFDRHDERQPFYLSILPAPKSQHSLPEYSSQRTRHCFAIRMRYHILPWGFLVNSVQSNTLARLQMKDPFLVSQLQGKDHFSGIFIG